MRHATRLMVIVPLAALVGTIGGCGPKPSIGMLMSRGISADYRGDHAEALANYRLVTDRRPGHADARYRQGLALLELGRPDEAREALTIAHELEPREASYFDALIDSLVAVGDDDALFETLERAATQTDGVEGYLALGRAARRVGFPEEAENALLVAVQLADAEDTEPVRALADLYLFIGDRNREIDALRVLYGIAPDDASVSERIRLTGEIPGPSFARSRAWLTERTNR